MTSSTDFIPPAYLDGAKEAWAALERLDHVLVSGHVNPDGDAAGSIIAAGDILGAKGKTFAMYIPEKLPQNLEFLQLPGPIYRSLDKIPFIPEATLYLDCSEPGRLAPELTRFAQLPAVNIDHHICHHGLGTEANFIKPEAAATSQLMAYVALAAGVPLEGPLGQAIAVGLMTDTGHFTHNNTSSDVYKLAALLEENGCDLHTVSEHLENGMPLAQLKLWGHLMERIHTRLNGKVACCKVWLDDLSRSGCEQADLEGFVDWLRRIKNVEIGLLIREVSRDASKFSLRSRGQTNVQEIATYFGGGGHKNAAGGTLSADPDKAETLLMVPIKKYLELNPEE